MENICFVLIDTQKNHPSSNQYHRLINKISNYDHIVIGTEGSKIADKIVTNARECFQYLAQHKKGKTLLIIDAYAGLLSLEDTKDILQYTRQGQYDVCLTENIAQGLIPMVVSEEFCSDLAYFIEDTVPLTNSLQGLMNWEYKGIDVGIFLAKDFAILRRVDFLPINKGASDALDTVQGQATLSTLEDFIAQNPQLLRNTPHYVAIELSPQTDSFYALDMANNPIMTTQQFQQIFDELQVLSPDAMISLGVWGDPFCHPNFKEIFSILCDTKHKILVESRGLNLDKELYEYVLAYKNAEIIIDISFSTEDDFKKYKNTGHTLFETKQFIESLPHQERVWTRLTRSPESEPHIKNFLQMFPHTTVIKADSLGRLAGQVVDLAPIQRHACFALRRELTILSNGDVLLCRQAPECVLGSLKTLSLQDMWDLNQESYTKQEQGDFDSCAQCKGCDDWWIWN